MHTFEIVDKFLENNECDFHGALSEGIIKEMEKKLGITFPRLYVDFLKKYGSLEWFGHSIYGFSEDEEIDTVICTLELRCEELIEGFKRLPHEGCVIESYGGGGCYFLFSSESKRAGEVALFTDEAYRDEVESWESFFDFLSYMFSL